MPIHIVSAELQTLIFIVIFLIILIFSFRRTKGEIFFSVGITSELKGLAILMIILSHIGYFLVDNNKFLYPLSVGAGVGVNLFFFLSGYGLSVSAINKGCSVLNFYKNRVLKLFIPLWIVLFIILTSDYFILSRIYNLDEIWHSFLGYFSSADLAVNINSPLWFITPIMIYYFLFPLIFNKKYLFVSGILLIIISYFLLFNNQIDDFLISSKILSKNLLSLYQIHFAAFPLGLIVADLIANKKFTRQIWISLSKLFKKHQKTKFILWSSSVFLAIIIVSYMAIHSAVGEGKFKEQFVSLVTSLLIVFIFVFKNIKTSLFEIFGIYSYEVYLVHWPILSRFDIFFNHFPPALVVFFYLILFLIISAILQKITNFIVSRI